MDPKNKVGSTLQSCPDKGGTVQSKGSTKLVNNDCNGKLEEVSDVQQKQELSKSKKRRLRKHRNFNPKPEQGSEKCPEPDSCISKSVLPSSQNCVDSAKKEVSEEIQTERKIKRNPCLKNNESRISPCVKTNQESDSSDVKLISPNPTMPSNEDKMSKGDQSQKSREDVLAQREAKKQMKLLAKNKKKDTEPNKGVEQKPAEILAAEQPKTQPDLSNHAIAPDQNSQSKTKEQIMAEREMKKKAKQAAKQQKQESKKAEAATEGTSDKTGEAKKNEHKKENEKPEEREADNRLADVKSSDKSDIAKTDLKTSVSLKAANNEKSKSEIRAERRAIQEAQRAAKEAEKQKKTQKPTEQKPSEPKSKDPAPSKLKEQIKEKKTVISMRPNLNRVKLFSHLQYETKLLETKIVSDIHPSIIELGVKYRARVINGSNARCVAFLQALKKMIMDYVTPAEKEFPRGLETKLAPAMAYLNQNRPLSVSINNALRHVKSHLTQLPNNVTDDEARTKLCDAIDTYIRDQIDVARVAISKTVQKKIANGDVILTYACSSVVYELMVESHRGGAQFSVVVVDAGPGFEGREMLRRLTHHGISCSYVLISAVSFIMRQVTKVLIGAHGLLANGYVMSRAGSSLVALVAHAYNVPVLVCCETHKFSERVQTDAFVYNELGNPDDIVPSDSQLANWKSIPCLSPLNLLYDITPPDLVTAVVTEVAILPCTSVPVILRIKPSDMAV